MKGNRVLIEEFGIGHVIASVHNGILHDLLIDPLNQKDAPIIGSILTAKLQNWNKSINGTFLTLPNSLRGFLKGDYYLPRHSIVPVYIGVLVAPEKAQPVSLKLILKGRTVILTPNNPGINVSRQIQSHTVRKNLLDIFENIKEKLPENCGLIIRSSAAHAEVPDIINEVNEKIDQYHLIANDDLSEPRIIVPPLKARERAMLDWDLKDPSSVVEEKACFDRYGVWEQISMFLINRVELANGGFLFIEPTAAFIAVDVNTGGDISSAGALKTNLLAMEELPRQLEVRGLGGKVVIEFAPLSKKDRSKVETEFKKALAKYKTKYIIAGWTKLGNLEVQKTRDKTPILEILKKDERFSESYFTRNY